MADGSDATRLVFKVVDRFGADRLLGGGDVHFQLDGPGVLVGDNPFSLAETGGVGAVWIKAQSGAGGRIQVTATHSTLGAKPVAIEVRPAVAPDFPFRLCLKTRPAARSDEFSDRAWVIANQKEPTNDAAVA